MLIEPFTKVPNTMLGDIITVVNKTEQTSQELHDGRGVDISKTKAQIRISTLNSLFLFLLVKKERYITLLLTLKLIFKLRLKEYGAKRKERGRNSLSGDASERIGSHFQAGREASK